MLQIITKDHHSGRNLRSGISVHLHFAILFNQFKINNDIIINKILTIIETPVAAEYLFKGAGALVKLRDTGIY
jgi:hypothetical protein